MRRLSLVSLRCIVGEKEEEKRPTSERRDGTGDLGCSRREWEPGRCDGGGVHKRSVSGRREAPDNGQWMEAWLQP